MVDESKEIKQEETAIEQADPLARSLAEIITVIDVATESMRQETNRAEHLYSHSKSKEHRMLRAQYQFSLQGLILIQKKAHEIIQNTLMQAVNPARFTVIKDKKEDEIPS